MRQGRLLCNRKLRSYYINPPGDAHDFCKERSALCAAKIGAGNVIIKIIMTFPIVYNTTFSGKKPNNFGKLCHVFGRLIRRCFFRSKP